jgi:hypothetical protein
LKGQMGLKKKPSHLQQNLQGDLKGQVDLKTNQNLRADQKEDRKDQGDEKE